MPENPLGSLCSLNVYLPITRGSPRSGAEASPTMARAVVAKDRAADRPAEA